MKYKIFKNVALQQNQKLQWRWERILVDFIADQIVYMDESICNERTGDRKYGWAPIGIEAKTKCLYKRTKRYFILPAYTIQSYTEILIHQNSITGDIFVEWILEKIIPNINAWPAPKSVLIINNIFIHKSPKIKQTIKNKNIVFVFLPLYSPQYNQIEKNFHNLKI